MTKIKLTMTPCASLRSGNTYDFSFASGRTIMYKVQAMPAGESALVQHQPYSNKWTIFHLRDGVQVEWPGNYDSAEQALVALQEVTE